MTTAFPGAGLQLEDVSVSFGATRALEDVSLDIAPGEAVALVGPSGAGKTTLLRLLNGSVRPSAGVVKFDGHPLNMLRSSELQEVRSRVGFIHQDLRLVPNVRAIHNVIAGQLGQLSVPRSLMVMFFPPRDLVRDVYQILERVGIPEKMFERTDRLSGGQQQRVAIARALFQRPTVMLADEPVSSVDPARARDAIELLTSISRERGLTLCVSLHNLELAQQFFPRLVGLRRGRIAFDLRTSETEQRMFDSLYALTAEEMLEYAR